MTELLVHSVETAGRVHLTLKQRNPCTAKLVPWLISRPGDSDETIFVPLLGDTTYVCAIERPGATIAFGNDVAAYEVRESASLAATLRTTRRFESYAEVTSRLGLRVTPIQYRGGSQRATTDFMREIRAMHDLNIYPLTDGRFLAGDFASLVVASNVVDLPATAVVVHMHFADLWEELAAHIATVPGKPSVLVTVTAGDPEIQARILARFPGARIIIVENRGFDLGPFVRLLNEGVFDGAELICKIHSKRSLRRDGTPSLLGPLWRRFCLDALLGEAGRVSAIVDRFRRDDRVGIIGPARFRITAKSADRLTRLGRNRRNVAALAARIGLASPLPADFFAGTMFWARRSALEPIRALNLSAADFAGERRDGTVAHALERLFNPAAIKAGFRIEEVADRAWTGLPRPGGSPAP